MAYQSQRSRDNQARIQAARRQAQRLEEAELPDIDKIPFSEAVRRGLDEAVKQDHAQNAFRIQQTYRRFRAAESTATRVASTKTTATKPKARPTSAQSGPGLTTKSSKFVLLARLGVAEKDQAAIATRIASSKPGDRIVLPGHEIRVTETGVVCHHDPSTAFLSGWRWVGA